MDTSVATVSAEKVAQGRERILGELRKVIVGQDDVVEHVLIALFTGGHCLITGVPGLAKTLLIKTLADILHLDFKRIQFTPDLMPSDITAAGRSYPLEQPFFVLATQNPIELEGTYPLPEAQLDRFMFNVVIHYLSQDDEVTVVTQTTGTDRQTPDRVLTGADIL